MCSPDPSIKRTTVKQSLPGGRISIGFVASSRYVPSLPPSARRLLTFSLQTELAKTPDANDSAVLPRSSDTNIIGSAPHDDVSKAGVPEDRRDVLKTGIVVPVVDHGSARPHKILSDKTADDHTAASDVHHRTTKNREDGGSRYRAVSIHLTYPPPTLAAHNHLRSHMPGESCQAAANLMPTNLHQAHLENPRLRHPGLCLEFTRNFDTPCPRLSAKSTKYSKRRKVTGITTNEIRQ